MQRERTIYEAEGCLGIEFDRGVAELKGRLVTTSIKLKEDGKF